MFFFFIPCRMESIVIQFSKFQTELTWWYFIWNAYLSPSYFVLAHTQKHSGNGWTNNYIEWELGLKDSRILSDFESIFLWTAPPPQQVPQGQYSLYNLIANPLIGGFSWVYCLHIANQCYLAIHSMKGKLKLLSCNSHRTCLETWMEEPRSFRGHWKWHWF